jgi:hypothetical protein
VNKNEELEARACALVKQHRWLLPASVRAFFNELADFLKWETLKKEL